MPSDKATEALRRYRAEQSTAKQRLVIEAIESIAEHGLELNVAAVCRAAGVSREFAYSHAYLVHAIRQRARIQAEESRSAKADARVLSQGLRADRKTLLEKVRKQGVLIDEQRARLEDFEIQRRKWLGGKLEQSVNPDRLESLRASNERLIAENEVLNIKLREQLELVSSLSGDLVASRRAHTEDLAAANGYQGNVVTLAPPPATSIN